MNKLKEMTKRPLIAVHRGRSGGNIIENTSQAAKAAVLSGGDIVEFDVEHSLDKKIFIFHTGMERKLGKVCWSIRLKTARGIKAKTLINEHDGASSFKLQTLDEYLDEVKGKCLLNLDRVWRADVGKCLKTIDEKGMIDSIIIKTGVNERDRKIMREVVKYPDLFYMGIVRSKSQLETLEIMAAEEDLKIDGVEVIFKSEDDYLCSDEFIEYCSNKGYIIWVNAINLNRRPDMCANHGDDVSITQTPSSGWGWLINKGFDIIQTDWPELMRRHINGEI